MTFDRKAAVDEEDAGVPSVQVAGLEAMAGVALEPTARTSAPLQVLYEQAELGGGVGGHGGDDSVALKQALQDRVLGAAASCRWSQQPCTCTRD